MTQRNRTTRSYMLRRIPPDVHMLWKAAAAMRGGITMEDFALAAIRMVARRVVTRVANVEKELADEEAALGIQAEAGMTASGAPVGEVPPMSPDVDVDTADVKRPETAS